MVGIIRSSMDGGCICSLGFFRSNQWSTTGTSKVVVCAVLSVGKVHIKDPLVLIGKSNLEKKYITMTIRLTSNNR